MLPSLAVTLKLAVIFPAFHATELLAATLEENVGVTL